MHMNTTSDTIDVYEEVLKGAHRGIDSIDELLKVCEDEKFKSELLKSQDEYKLIAKEASDGLNKLGGAPRELSAMERMGMWGMVRAKTMGDHSTENMAEMIVKGMQMANEKMHEMTSKYPDADDNAIKLADRLLEMQSKHRDTYKSYAN